MEEINNTIASFIALIETGCVSIEDNEKQLQFLCDKLAFQMHLVTYTYDDTDYPDSPRTSYEEIRKTVSKKFPNYGFYNAPEFVTQHVGKTGTNIGDAIDDICDIYKDLYEVMWCFENTSPDDALWHLEESYKYHWKEHLRDLQKYLYHFNNE